MLRSRNSWISSSRTFCATWSIVIRLHQLSVCQLLLLPDLLPSSVGGGGAGAGSDDGKRRRADSLPKWRQLVVTLILRNILRVPGQPEEMSGSVCRCGQGVSSIYPCIWPCINPCTLYTTTYQPLYLKYPPLYVDADKVCVKYPPLYLTPSLHSYYHFKLLCVVYLVMWHSENYTNYQSVVIQHVCSVSYH